MRQSRRQLLATWSWLPFLWTAHSRGVMERGLPGKLMGKSSGKVSVDARLGWQATGISIDSGKNLRIKVIAGEWTDWRGQTPYTPGIGWNYICANAIPADQCVEPLPEFYKGALIGRIGNAVFGIGNEIAIEAPASGELFLGINDDPQGLSDNDGVLTVKVNQ